MINIRLSLVLYLYIGYVMLIYRNIDVKYFDRKCRFLVIC